MSFSSKTKEDLVKLKLRTKNERLSLICALVNTAGTLGLGGNKSFKLNFVTESYPLGKYIASLVTGLYDTQARLTLHAGQKSNRSTHVELSGDGVKKLLFDVGVLYYVDGAYTLSSNVLPSLLDGEKLKRAFLRGAFLGAGSVVDPSRNYHLEIICRNASFANALVDCISFFGLKAKAMVRKEIYVVYLKEGEHICDLLTLIGADLATLEFESARVVKDVRNYINRTSNCETANIGKTVRASVVQIEKIMFLKDEMTLEALPPQLYDAAEARLNNPNASLTELGELLNIGRSGMSHRLNRLMRLADELQISKGDHYATQGFNDQG